MTWSVVEKKAAEITKLTYYNFFLVQHFSFTFILINLYSKSWFLNGAPWGNCRRFMRWWKASNNINKWGCTITYSFNNYQIKVCDLNDWMVLCAACFRAKHRQIIIQYFQIQIKCSELNLCMFCKFNVHLRMECALGLLFHTPNTIPHILPK